MYSKISPCLNCTERKLGCHSNCEKEKEWKQYLESIKKIKQEVMTRQNSLDEVKISGIEKAKKRKRR